MLGYASWRDLKRREVEDLTWIVFGVPGLTFNVYELLIGSTSPFQLIVPIVLATVLSFVLAYLGLFGGADFKAFVVLSILLPIPPQSIRPVSGFISVIYPLTLFSNSAVAGALMAIVMLMRNLLMARRDGPLFEALESESNLKKFVVLLSGTKVKLDAVRGPPFQYPLEKPVGGDASRRQLVLMPNTEDDNAAIETFQLLKREGINEVWVSHTLPFIVFITFGYFSSLIVGDLVLWFLKWALFTV